MGGAAVHTSPSVHRANQRLSGETSPTAADRQTPELAGLRRIADCRWKIFLTTGHWRLATNFRAAFAWIGRLVGAVIVFPFLGGTNRYRIGCDSVRAQVRRVNRSPPGRRRTTGTTMNTATAGVRLHERSLRHMASDRTFSVCNNGLFRLVVHPMLTAA